MTTAVEGEVHPDRQAVVPIRVRGPKGEIARVQAVIDTGFNDFLTLPSWAVERLELSLRHAAQFTLADGSVSRTRIFDAEMEWFGAWRRVEVTEVDANALLGMLSLENCLLTVEVASGGRVEIRPLSG
jgi:clan AA aspartic protease